MNCQTCGAALGRGTAAHHLTCRYCGAVHSDRPAPEKRPYEDALDAALDETGAFQGTGSQSIESFELQGQCYSSTAEVPPDVEAAINDASRALDDIFGGPPMKTHMVGKISPAQAAAAAAAESAEPAVARSTARASTSVADIEDPAMDDTSPIMNETTAEILAAAQIHSHVVAKAREMAEAAAEPAAAAVAPSAAPAPPPSVPAPDAARPAASRVVLASDPVPVEQPTWMKHAMAITAIAVIAMFTAAGIAIVVFH